MNYTDPNPNWDESKFHAALAPHLTNASFPAHFIVDTGRSGAQPAGRLEWGHWCNIKDAGFGIRPSSDTPTDLLDAFVWVKPGGEGDGTSDEDAVRYDEMCSSESSVVPAPEAGEWWVPPFPCLEALSFGSESYTDFLQGSKNTSRCLLRMLTRPLGRAGVSRRSRRRLTRTGRRKLGMLTGLDGWGGSPCSPRIPHARLVKN